MSNNPSLDPNDIRVLGVLIEKQRTVPDTYPLSLNSLLAGCNQKTSRDPVMTLSEAEVAQSLDKLRGMSLVMESSGSRVSRYGHNIERVMAIPTQSSAILAVLMLRGPQTAGELRINCERLHRFADISTVEGFLCELQERATGSLVEELPRRPGGRENRWMHTLSPAQLETLRHAEPEASHAENNSDAVRELRNELDAIRAEVADLKMQLAELTQQIAK
ncbi:MAG: hypothetical protein RL210_262 [Pseudomonadota bacterium]|jgi:uncharacterized protein YceH (UPF0502 family)|nr:uncharacterized protein [Pseudomonadota bacterium]